jgi:hypothetical protein
MTTYTANEFGTRVLKDLGLVGAEETPSSADLEWAKETAAAEISMLAALNLPIWNGSEVAIPQEYLTMLSRRVGLAVAPSFGMMDAASAMSAMREAERYLTELASPRPVPLKMKTDLPARGSVFNFTYGR